MAFLLDVDVLVSIRLLFRIETPKDAYSVIQKCVRLNLPYSLFFFSC